MDLLGSILSNMDAPPTTDNKKAKEEKAKLMKKQAIEKKKKADFRAKIEKEVTEFIQDSKRNRMKYPAMDKIQRSIVHDVAEVAGLSTFSFGEEELDRYVMLFKKEFPPSDEELAAYRNGQDYDPDNAGKEEESREVSWVHKADNSKSPTKRSRLQPSSTSEGLPASNYKDKYKHLLGEDSGKRAAKITKSNSAYGCVPSENKRDLRSIEETLNDIRKRKKQRSDDGEEENE